MMSAQKPSRYRVSDRFGQRAVPRRATAMDPYPASFSSPRSEYVQRIQARRKIRLAQEEDHPGDVSPTLRRRMGDPLADLFSESGRVMYAKSSEGLKDVLQEVFDASVPELDAMVKEELGRRGQDEAKKFYRQWINEIVEVIITRGMNEASAALEELANAYAAEQVMEEDGDELMDVDELSEEDIEVVEEEEPSEEGDEEEPEEGEEEEPEEGEEEEGGGAALDELFEEAGMVREPGLYRRQVPKKRPVTARKPPRGPQYVRPGTYAEKRRRAHLKEPVKPGRLAQYLSTPKTPKKRAKALREGVTVYSSLFAGELVAPSGDLIGVIVGKTEQDVINILRTEAKKYHRSHGRAPVKSVVEATTLRKEFTGNTLTDACVAFNAGSKAFYWQPAE